MTETDLLPPYQEIEAAHALLGDPPSQRNVLEMAVRLVDAGIDPIPIFKGAVLESLRHALKNNKLPSPRDKKLKGAAGNEFQIAVSWWKLKLTGDQKPATTITKKKYPNHKAQCHPAITRALKRHGLLAKERALFDLAWNGPDGPDHGFMSAWEEYRDELRKPLADLMGKLPQGEPKKGGDLIREAIQLATKY